MAAAATLYTPQVLALATSLAQWPWDDALPLQGSARSKSCGSVVRLGLASDHEGRISRIALKAQACAIGQAAAAIFAGGACGRSSGEIESALAGVTAWLRGDAERPDWPGLDALDGARGYPARHSAILLSWQAATDLLFTGDKRG